MWQGHLLCRIPFECQNAEIIASLEYVMEPKSAAEGGGQGLCIYLCDPSVEGWDRHFDGSGPLGFVGKKGAIVGVGIDCTGDFCEGSPASVAIKRASDSKLLCAPVVLEGGVVTQKEDFWRSVKIRFDIEDNTCDVIIGGVTVLDDVPFTGVKIPKILCVGVCAGTGGGRTNHICVNKLKLRELDSSERSKRDKQVESTRASIAVSTASLCDNCATQTGTVYCEQCESLLCHLCSETIHEFRALSWHSLGSAADAPSQFNLSELDSEAVEAIMRRAITTMASAQLGAALHTWQDAAEEVSRQRAIVSNSVHHLVNQSLNRAWNKWRTETEDSQQSEQALRHALMTLVMKQLSLFFCVWRRAVDDVQRQRQSGRLAVSMMRNCWLQRAWRKWREVSTEDLRVRTVMQGVVHKMMNRLLSASFETWQANAYDRKHDRQTLRHAVMKLINAQQARALGKWRQEANDLQYQENALRHGLMRLTNALMGAALGTWREVVAAMKRQQQILRGAITRMMQRTLSAAWETWQANATEVQLPV